MKVRYSYLPEQFENPDQIFNALREVVARGDYTLGNAVAEFEQRFAALIGTKYAVGVGSGTDALKLSLKAVGIGHGDEVITAANTFIATVGAIAEIGAVPVLVDCDDTFCMNVDLVEAAITERTKAVMPVQFTGEVVDMPRLMALCDRCKLPVIEDACQGILASIDGKLAGTWGLASGFSLHPLKNLNVWGDAGIIVTDDADIHRRLKLLRNHGMVDRDTIALLGYNSRLDTLQAVVGNWLISDTHKITEQRIANGEYLSQHLAGIKGIRIPPQRDNVRRVYHLYIVFAENRDALLNHCINNGIEAKIHYPIPLYQQEGLQSLGYPAGTFPVTDRHTKEIITFPVDQHLKREHLDHIISTVRDFYANA
jgi:dTDP-4-amino-4,6-dideoxygalactose transaminase